MEDTIRCNKGETNLAGYSYAYWNSWQILIHEMKNDDAEMLKALLCSFYIEWMTLYDMPCDINSTIANADTMTDEQIALARTKVVVPDFRTMPEYNPIEVSIDRFQDYVLEWIFHTTPEVVRNIIDYLKQDMTVRLPKLAASLYSSYNAMKLMSYSIRDSSRYLKNNEFSEKEPSVSELVNTISEFILKSKKED